MMARRCAAALTNGCGWAGGKEPDMKGMMIVVTWGARDRCRVGNLLMRVASEEKTSSCMQVGRISVQFE